MIEITAKDKALIEQYDKALQIVRDRTRGVAEGWHTGFYLWGEGGISKSYTVIEELNRLEIPYKHSPGRMTGRGLFDIFCEYPESIHLLEDMESLFKDKRASELLRSALWTNKIKLDVQHQERLITWTTANGRIESMFSGGVILTMNLPLDNLPELRALKSRIAHLHLQPSNEMLGAKMREIASRGYQYGNGILTPEEAMEVCQHVQRRLNDIGRNYDFRVLVVSFQDRLQDKAGHSKTGWQEMIETRLKERITMSRGKIEKQADEKALAHEIDAMKMSIKEKLQMWKEKTGKSKDAYYSRLKK